MRRTPNLWPATLALLSFLFVSSACSTGAKTKEPEDLKADAGAPAKPFDPQAKPAAAKPAAAQTPDAALGVATVASLISISDVMVREPDRFHKVLCSDGNIYDISYDGARFSLAAEPLSVCVLMADTKDMKPLGICGDANCEAAAVAECPEPEKTELTKTFAEDQSPERCWNVGTLGGIKFSVLMSRVGQSCQAQTLVKTPSSWQVLSSIDGTYETRKTNTSQGTGCWWEAGQNFSYEGDWFGTSKRVAPIMVFQKEGGLYALVRSSWSGTDNYQLFRIDGDQAREVESFAEAFKDPAPSPPAAPVPASVPEKDKKPVTKGKRNKKGDARPKDAPPPASPVPAPADLPEPPVPPDPQPETQASPEPATPPPATTPSTDSTPPPPDAVDPQPEHP